MEKKEFVTKWRKMLKLQQKLDERILSESGLTYQDIVDRRGYVSAILDELGELNHELKADWCWWKKSQTPVNQDRVLEEFVDVLHFVLSWQLAHHEIKGTPLSVFTNRAFDEYKNRYSFVNETLRVAAAFQPMMHYLGVPNIYPPVSQLMYLMRNLELDFEDVCQTYISKNKENHARQDRGY